jgi:trimethylamine---corrinoid protein Co-methyltransferase
MNDTFFPQAIPAFSMFSEAQCQRIHFAALEILRRTGVRVYEKEALNLLQDAGAVITDDTLAMIPASLVEWAVRQAPSRIGLCARGTDEVVVPLEGRQTNFGPGSDCPNYLDPRTGDARPFTSADMIACVRLVDSLPQIGFVMSMGIPTDLLQTDQGNVYRQQFALMLENSTKPTVFVADDRNDCEAIAAMAAAAAGGPDALRLNPTLLLYSEPSTPLRHTRTATEKLLFMAEKQLPVVHSPAPMMGGTAPMTLAGALALGNAEVLSSLVIHQLKKPGAPFVYGTGLHHMDMRTSISVYGAPEFQLARVGVAAMGQYYGLPTWGYAGHTDSVVMDEQASADATFSVMVALLTGTNLVHDVGYLEAGLTASPEMIVFTAEVIEMLRHFVAGVSLDAESMALEVIHRVGPGGTYLTEDHTLKHFREAWQPTLFDRRRSPNWRADGSPSLGKRLREKTIALLDSGVNTPLPDSVKSEIGYILADSADQG